MNQKTAKVTIADGVDIGKPRRVNAILAGMNNRGMQVYAGTVFGAEKAKRRAKGKAQRAARKAGRR